MPFVAPAGTPLELAEVLAALFDGARSNAPNEALHGELARLSKTDRCWSFSTGRAAMVVALRAMKRLKGEHKNQVVIPGYTCYSVAAAVERAGLEPVLCDINPQTLSFDGERLRRLDFTRVLAIVTTNLYGIPNCTLEIENFARSRDTFLLDDAAQALGATLRDRPTGGFGDVGLFSFDKGKNVSTMQGGALVARDGALADAIEEQWRAVPRATLGYTFGAAAALLPYALLLKPSRYGLVAALPGTGLGGTPYEPHYAITRYSRVLAGLAVRLVRRLDEINAHRIDNALRLWKALAGIPSLRFIEPPASAKPVYLRFPVLAPSSADRTRLLAAFKDAGIGATASYPNALCDVPQVRARLGSLTTDTPGARIVAERVITLPTHAYSPDGLASTVRAIALDTLGA